MSQYFEARRDEYLQRLKAVSTEGAWTEWLQFFLDAVASQATEAHARLERILVLQAEYRAQARQSPSRAALPAVDLIMQEIIVTAPDVASFVGCNYRTARSALDSLSAMSIIQPLAKSHPQRWWARHLIAEVYER